MIFQLKIKETTYRAIIFLQIHKYKVQTMKKTDLIQIKVLINIKEAILILRSSIYKLYN